MLHSFSTRKGKAIPVTDHGGLWGCETSRLPRLPDNWLTQCGEFVSLTRQSTSNILGTRFCWKMIYCFNHAVKQLVAFDGV
jgi:hypothetical protein